MLALRIEIAPKLWSGSMRSSMALSLLVLLVIQFAPQCFGEAPLAAPSGMTAAAARFPRNQQEFDQMFEQVKNWGRWGPDDRLGAANLITQEKRKQAAALVKHGLVIGLGHPLMTERAQDNYAPLEIMAGGVTGDDSGQQIHGEGIKLFTHGEAHAHMDTLCHFAYKGRVYNGYSNKEEFTAKGCAKLGAENYKDGIVTRGILIDLPRLKNVPYLEPGTPIFVEDLEAWEKKAGVTIATGDAIFVRTGRWVRRAKLGPWNLIDSQAGIHASVVPWLKKRGVSFVGSESGFEVVPSQVEGINSQGLISIPVHTLLLTAVGIAIFDHQNLDRLAETAAALNRWEFLLTAAPVLVPGGSGSPLNALAVF